jgi:hypothetical protein
VSFCRHLIRMPPSARNAAGRLPRSVSSTQG